MKNKSIILLCLITLILGITQCSAQHNVPANTDVPAVSAQDLLKPDMFPNAQMGMEIQSFADGDVARVITVGGVFLLNKADDTIECSQTISKLRKVGLIKLPAGTLKDIKITHKSSGAVILSGNGSIVRVNGDSLLMIQPAKDGDIQAQLLFTPDYHRETNGNYNFFDPFGGISFFEHSKSPVTKFQAAADPITVTWPWKAGNVFWAGVSPPKPYDWNYPLKNRVVVYGNSTEFPVFPSDKTIVDYKNKGYGTILYLHCEQMWNHWNLDLTPKNPTDLLRVANTAHANGMKVMPYISPHYFIKNTPAEPRAHPDPHYGPSWHTGSNAKLYMEYATKLVKNQKIDGLYWDGMYEWAGAMATNYWLARAARELVGDNNPLEFHATTDILGTPAGHDGVYLPTMHSYFDMILKGEGEYERNDPAYIRYIASTYNISNATAVACYFNELPMPKTFDILLRANVYLHFPLNQPQEQVEDLYSKYYWPRLTPALRGEIIEDLTTPKGIFAEYRKSLLEKNK